MSDKELAYSLIDELPAEYLEKAIVMLAKLSKSGREKDDLEKRRIAYENIMRIIHPCPNLNPDYKQEYLDYLDERYGV